MKSFGQYYIITVINTYTFSSEFNCGLLTKDHIINYVFTEWKYITSGSHHIRMMDGGHFYLKEPKNTDMISYHINRLFIKTLMKSFGHYRP